jgi:hypothetical protein
MFNPFLISEGMPSLFNITDKTLARKKFSEKYFGELGISFWGTESLIL